MKVRFIQLQEGTVINFDNVVQFDYARADNKIHLTTVEGTIIGLSCGYEEYIELLSLLEVI